MAGRRWMSDEQKPLQTRVPRVVGLHGRGTPGDEDLIARHIKDELCVRCGSDGHHDTDCPNLKSDLNENRRKPALLNALGLTGFGEDQTREILFGNRKKPSKYWFPVPSTSNSAAISNPLGLVGSSEDETREILFGKVKMPSRYQFLHGPSPTRNTKSIRGSITTSSATPAESELTSDSPVRDADSSQKDGSVTHQESEGVVQRTWAVPKNLRRAWQIIAEEEASREAARATAAESGSQAGKYRDGIIPSQRHEQRTIGANIGSRAKSITKSFLDTESNHNSTPFNGHINEEQKTSVTPAEKGHHLIGIYNLSLHTDKDSLIQELGRFGKVKYAIIVVHRGTTVPKGIAYAKYESSNDAERAVAAMDGRILNGREVGVKSFDSVRHVKGWARFADPVTGIPNRLADKDSSAEALETYHSTVEVAANQFSRVHIIGTNELGKLAAHSLANMKARRPITILMHSERLIRKWKSEGENIVLVRGGVADPRFGFDIERTTLTRDEHEQLTLDDKTTDTSDDNPSIINQLIVTCSGWDAIPSLLSIRDRLDSESTIMFLQNIEGVIDLVNERVFENPATRPQYIRTFTTHGLMNHPDRTFAVKHYKMGNIQMRHAGDLSLAEVQEKHPSTYDLIKLFQRSTELRGQVPRSMALLMYHKLMHLTVDAVLGPLCVAFDCKILDLRFNYVVSQNMRAMLEEICAVIQKMPESQELLATYDVGKGSSLRYFNPDYMMKVLAKVCDEMQQDQEHPLARKVKMGHRTDVHFTNGYFIAQAEKLGIEMPVNLFVYRLVKAKTAMNQKRITGWIPFAKDKKGMFQPKREM